MVDDFLSICLDSRYNQNDLVLMSQSKLKVIKARIVEKDMERANQNWKLITARIVEKDMESTEQSRITPHFPSCTSKKIWQKKKKTEMEIRSEDSMWNASLTDQRVTKMLDLNTAVW